MTNVGIPTDVIFYALGALVLLVYSDLRFAVRRLQKGANQRDFVLLRICDKLGIHYTTGDDT